MDEYVFHHLLISTNMYLSIFHVNIICHSNDMFEFYTTNEPRCEVMSPRTINKLNPGIERVIPRTLGESDIPSVLTGVAF